MKKVIKICIVFAICLNLFSCLKKVEKYEPNTNLFDNKQIDLSNVSQNFDYTNQFDLIINNQSTWMLNKDIAGDISGYCITDLDNNGLLEVIVSTISGSARFNTSTIYEVTSDLNDIKEVEWPSVEGGSGINIMKDNIDCYIDSSSNTYYYIFESTLKSNIYDYTEVISSLSLKNNLITEKSLASKTVTSTEDINTDKIPEQTTVYTDANGNTISNEDYDLITTNTFGSNYDKATATFKWVSYSYDDYDNFLNLSNDEIKKLLNESFNDFHVILK